MLIAAKE